MILLANSILYEEFHGNYDDDDSEDDDENLELPEFEFKIKTRLFPKLFGKDRPINYQMKVYQKEDTQIDIITSNNIELDSRKGTDATYDTILDQTNGTNALRFERISEYEFSLSFAYPFSMFTAFAAAICILKNFKRKNVN